MAKLRQTKVAPCHSSSASPSASTNNPSNSSIIFFESSLCQFLNVKLPLSYVTLVILLLHTAAVLEEPVNVSTNSAVICWGKPEANSPVRLYQLKIEPAAPGDYNGGIAGEPLFTIDVPVVAGKDRYCENIDGLEEDTRYIYTVTAMHSNGLAVQNVDRRSFSTKANSCSSQVCSGGTCSNINEPPYFHCMCYLGYYGRACENYNPCVNMPCAPYECINITTNQFACICPNGAQYTDVSDCEELQRDPCKKEPCQNDGQCVNIEDGDFRCQCEQGWRGTRCELPDRCQFVICQNGGKCREVDGSPLGFVCDCPPGVSGDFCDGPSPCQTLNCMNGGRCEVDPISKEPSCLCQDGWHGTKCELVDPCHASRNPCQNGAVCEASVDSQEAVCRCLVEYYGAFCQHFDPCAAEEKCSRHGTCNIDSTSSKGYTCACDDGWSGTSCQDKNLCIIDEPCKNAGQCTYLGHNKYSCACMENSGFWGPNCQFYDQCHKFPCQNGGKCRNITSDNNSENDYVCLCEANYEGKNCEVLNLCKIENYCGRGTCTSKGHNKASCECQLGYYGDRCEHYDVCKVRNPCQNGGTCEATADNGYKCSCNNGYSGPDCDKFDTCQNNPCRNDGICVLMDDRLGVYQCQCRDGLSTGDRCEFTNPCMNPKQCAVNFVCLNTTTEHSLCRPLDPSAFPVGASCTKDSECFNSGKCTNKGVCECLSPFEGDRCQDINPCRDPMACSGKGRCERLSSSNAKCICDPGFFGAKCQYEDKCLATSCENGGNCVLLVGTVKVPKCHCRDGYSGDNCAIANKECVDNLCSNGGRCLTLGFATPQYQEGYVCECPPEFFGSKCQRLRTCPATPPLDRKSIGALRWPETGAGNMSSIVCPYGSRRPGGPDAIQFGFAKRPCTIKKSKHMIEVEWGDISSKFCQNEPKSLSEAKRIIQDMMQTVSNEGRLIDVDTMRYCAQVLHNLLAAYTLTDKESAQQHVSLISKLMNAPSDVIYASEGNYSTSRTIVEDLEDLARRFVMATEETPLQVVTSSSQGSVTVHRRKLSLTSENLNVVIITQDALSASKLGMKYQSLDGLVSVYIPPDIFKSRTSQLYSNSISPVDSLAKAAAASATPSQISGQRLAAATSKQQTTHRLQVTTFNHDKFFEPIRPTSSSSSGSSGGSGSSSSGGLDGIFFPPDSRVVSVSLDNKATIQDVSTNNPIEISFPVLPKQKTESLCVFWKEDARYWSQTGLVTRPHANGTLCQSTHLTSFTVFVRAMSMTLEGELAPSILPFVGTGLAIIAYTLTIITYCLFGSLRREASGNVVLSLATALVLLNISFLAAAVRTRFQDQHLCNAVGVALHFFLLASVMWHVVDALFSYNNVTRPVAMTTTSSVPPSHLASATSTVNTANSAAVLMAAAANAHGHAASASLASSVHASSAADSQVSSSLFIKCALFAWGMPLIITTPTIIIKQGNYDIRDIYCRLTPDLETTYYGGLVLPCSVIVIVGVGFHLIALKLIQTQSNEQKKFQNSQQIQFQSHQTSFIQSTRMNLLIMTLVLISFSLTWIYAQFFFSQSLPTFEFVFCCGNVFQSWCFFTSRCMLLREARDAWKMFFSAGEMKPHVVGDARLLKRNAYDDGVNHALLPSQNNSAMTPEKLPLSGTNHIHMNGGRKSLGGGHVNTLDSPYRHYNSNGHSGHAIPENFGFEKDLRDNSALTHRSSPISNASNSAAVIFGETIEIKKAAAQAFAAAGSSSKSVTDESIRDEEEFIRSPGSLPHPDNFWQLPSDRVSPTTSNYIPSPPISDPNRESYV